MTAAMRWRNRASRPTARTSRGCRARTAGCRCGSRPSIATAVTCTARVRCSTRRTSTPSPRGVRDSAPCAWSPDGRSVALNRNERGFGRLVVVDVGTGRANERSKGWHHGLDWGAPGVVCVRSGARTAPQVTVLDPAAAGSTGRRSLARGAPAELDSLDLPEPDPVTWTSSDGTSVHGILWRPLAPRREPPPLLVDVHGGPTGQAVVGWAPRVRWYLSRGWAVLAPNPRGSTGYGRGYLRALDGGWGEVDVADTVTGIRALAVRGDVDGERVAVMGGSAGGFTALLVGATSPPAVRGGEPLRRHRPAGSRGDHAPLRVDLPRHARRPAARVRGATAIVRRRRAHEITVPVLVLQGDDDKVVPPRSPSRSSARCAPPARRSNTTCMRARGTAGHVPTP